MNDVQIMNKHRLSLEKIATYQKGKRFNNALRVIEHLSFFRDATLLDVGCCNGIISFPASKYCKEVYGIEFQKKDYAPNVTHPMLKYL